MQALCFFILSKLQIVCYGFFLTAECYKLLTSSISTSRYIISLIFWADKTEYQYSPNQRNKENNPQQFIMQYSNWQMIKATNVQQAGFRVGYKHHMEFTHYTAMGRYMHPYKVHVYWPVKKWQEFLTGVFVIWHRR